MTKAPHPAGTFCWAELATSDTDGAKAFYTGLFGWGVSRYSPRWTWRTWAVWPSCRTHRGQCSPSSVSRIRASRKAFGGL